MTTPDPRIARLAELVDQLDDSQAPAAVEARTLLAEMQADADREARRRAHSAHQAQRDAFYRGRRGRG